ncbi:ATP-binding protein [Aliikangiella maris]|uniref:ATP-binding protein n=2 Tax=Aliikangiella maris TaxID=3162458 RepID=A0ABV2BY46_9GAMM
MYRFYILLLLFIGTHLAAANSQSPYRGFNKHFHRYSVEQGLNQVTVTAIYRDLEGYLWVGTQGGLARFDASHFANFTKNSEGKTKIKNNFISAITQCSPNIIWAANVTGLERLDKTKGEFQFFDIFKDLDNGLITELLCWKNYLLIGTSGAGVLLFDLKSNQLQAQYKNARESQVVPTIDGLSFMGDNILVVSDNTVEVIHYDSAKKSFNFQQYLTNVKNSFAITKFATNKVFVISREGELTEISKLKDSWLFKSLDVQYNSENVINVKDIESNGEKIIIGTNDGLYTIQRSDLSVHYSTHQANEPRSLSDNNIRTLHLDKDNSVWVGTQSHGFNRSSISPSIFYHFSKSLTNDISGPLLDVRSFLFDGDLELIATENGMFYRLPNMTFFSKIDTLYPQLKFFDNILVTSLSKGRDGHYFIATRGFGLYHFNIDTKALTRINGDKDLGNVNFLNFGFLSSQGTHWFSAQKKGLIYFDETQKKLVSPNLKLTKMARSFSHVIEDKEGILWAGTIGAGLIRYNPKNNEMTQYLPEKNNPQSLGDEVIHMLTIDSNNRIWVCTLNGVSILNKERTGFINISKPQGLANISVWNIIYDGIDSVWMGHSQGISRIDEKTLHVDNYSIHEGLQGLEYNFGAISQSPSGYIYIGGTKGFNIVDNSRKNITHQLNNQISISQFSVLKHKKDNAGIMKPDYFFTDKALNLSYAENTFSFQLTNLDFYSSLKGKFEYRLTGFIDNWIEMPDETRTATFMNIDDGYYEFQARTATGTKNSPIFTLPITVNAIWWQSQPMLIIYWLIFFSVIISWFYQRYRRFTDLEKAHRSTSRTKEQLRLSLWGSGDELWDWDFIANEVTHSGECNWIDYQGLKETFSIADIKQIIHPDDYRPFIDSIKYHLKESIDTFDEMMRVRHINGNWLWCECKGKVVEKDQHGNILRICGTIKDINELKQQKENLAKLNLTLEQHVEERTKELKQRNQELENAITIIDQTQKQLIESEKLASLGSLVAGISHEVNTPLGVSLTAATSLQYEAQKVIKKVEANQLTRTDFNDFLKHSSDSVDIIYNNLQKASQLIRSFKQVAVDQTSDLAENFHIKSFLETLNISLSPIYKRHTVNVKLEVKTQCNIKTYPGALSQIITNLIINSLTHAFEEQNDAQIHIIADTTENNLLIIIEDNGIGIPPNIRSKIFAPFFTTKRGKGGSGLGLNIVYTLVVNKLKGAITFEPVQPQGARFIIQLPLDVTYFR